MACVMDKVEYKYYYSVHTFGIVVKSCCVDCGNNIRNSCILLCIAVSIVIILTGNVTATGWFRILLYIAVITLF